MAWRHVRYLYSFFCSSAAMLARDVEAASCVAPVSTTSVSTASMSTTSIPTSIPCTSMSPTGRWARFLSTALAQPSLPRYGTWKMRTIILWPSSTTTNAVSTAVV